MGTLFRHWSMVLFVAAALLLVGCKSDGKKGEKKEEPAKKTAAGPEAPGGAESPAPTPTTPAAPAAPADPLAKAFPMGPTAFEGVEALSYLPATTPILLVVSNPQSLLDRLGRETLTKRFAEYYEMAVAEVTQAFGENILVPANLPNIGVDPAGPAGFAMFSFNRPSGVLFCKLTDGEKFKTTLYSVAGRVREKLEPHVAGDAMVICPRNDEEICFVIRDNHLFFHFADMKDEEALARAMAFAARPKGDGSLADNEGFTAPVKALGFGKDATLYLNTAELMNGITGFDDGWVEDSLKNSEAQLRQARSADDKGEIEYWEERVRSDKEWAERHRKKKEAQKEMFSSLLTGTGNMVMGAELSEKSLRFKSYSEIAPDSKWANLARPLDKVSPLVLYTPQRPFYLAHMSVDLKAYWQIIEMAFEAEGVSIDEGAAQFKLLTGLDLHEDILGMLSGEIGLAVVGDMDEIMSKDGGPKGIGGTILLGVTGKEKALATMDKIVGLPMLEGFVRKLDVGQWEVPVPGWRTVTIKLTEDGLVATTDPEFIAALEKKERRSFIDTLENEEVKALLNLPDSLGVAAMDFGSFAMFFVGLRAFDMDWEAPEPEVDESGVPFSDEYKKLKQELKETRAKAREERKRIETETNRLLGQMLARIGVTVVVGQKKESRFYGYGGHYVADESVEALIGHLIEDGIAIEKLQSERRKSVWEMEDKAYEMERKLQDLRLQDIQRYEEEKARQEAAAPAEEPEEPVEMPAE